MIRAKAKRFGVAAALVFGLLAALAQSLPVGTVGSGKILSSVMYFEPPHEQVVKMRLTGAEMVPQPDASYDVKELKIESYFVDGRLQAVAEAPQCTYASLNNVASSPGRLALSLDGGKIRIEGEGFLWQQNDSSLYISNKVHTVIKVGDWKLTTP